MRTINVNGFDVHVTIEYNQNVLTELEALESAVRELRIEIFRDNAGNLWRKL